MNLPNKLTVARIVLVPFFAAFAILANRSGYWLWFLLAAIVFGAASLTDMLDGKIARSRGLVTSFGKFADPLADKILTSAAFIYMMLNGVCSSIVLIIILFREFAVSGIRMLAAGDGTVIPANMWGKAKTVTQMITILLFYVGSIFLAENAVFRIGISILCWVCAVMTILSGISYVKGAGKLLKDM